MTTGIIPVRFAVFEAGRKGYATGWRFPAGIKASMGQAGLSLYGESVKKRLTPLRGSASAPRQRESGENLPIFDYK
jgi:hypothetical protein